MLVIYAPLALSGPDRNHVEAVRERYDPNAAIVEAHFTLVFPFDGGEVDEVAAHAAGVCAETPAIAFRLEDAQAVREPLGAASSHVFLLPAQGEAAIRALHAALYTGPLSTHLRRDRTFHPHVTVAALPDHSLAEAVATGLMPLMISGRLETLHLAEFDGRALYPLRVLPLLS